MKSMELLENNKDILNKPLHKMQYMIKMLNNTQVLWKEEQLLEIRENDQNLQH